MKRKMFFIIIALLSVIYFNNGAPTEIADRIMIHSIGIDEKDGEYNVTMQVFSPSGTGSDTAIDPSLPNVSLVSGKGKNVNEAVRSCLLKLGGNIYIGQNQIILFGRDVDLSKKDELFGYFLSSSNAFLNVDCAMAEKTAAEILSIPIPGSAVSSEKYPDMIEAAAKNGRCIKTTFLDIMDSMESNDRTLILPIFSKADKQTKGKQSENSGGSQSDSALPESELEIKHGALIVNGKYKDRINYEQMGIAGVLNGEGNYIRTEIEIDGRSQTKTFKLRSREVQTDVGNGTINIYIKCRLSPKDARILQSRKDDSEADKIALKLLEEKSQKLCDEICSEHSAELLNADHYLKKFYPEIYRKYKDDTDHLYARVKYHVEYLI